MSTYLHWVQRTSKATAPLPTLLERSQATPLSPVLTQPSRALSTLRTLYVHCVAPCPCICFAHTLLLTTRVHRFRYIGDRGIKTVLAMGSDIRTVAAKYRCTCVEMHTPPHMK